MFESAVDRLRGDEPHEVERDRRRLAGAGVERRGAEGETEPVALDLGVVDRGDLDRPLVSVALDHDRGRGVGPAAVDRLSGAGVSVDLVGDRRLVAGNPVDGDDRSPGISWLRPANPSATSSTVELGFLDAESEEEENDEGDRRC